MLAKDTPYPGEGSGGIKLYITIDTPTNVHGDMFKVLKKMDVTFMKIMLITTTTAAFFDMTPDELFYTKASEDFWEHCEDTSLISSIAEDETVILEYIKEIEKCIQKTLSSYKESVLEYLCGNLLLYDVRTAHIEKYDYYTTTVVFV